MGSAEFITSVSEPPLLSTVRMGRAVRTEGGDKGPKRTICVGFLLVRKGTHGVKAMASFCGFSYSGNH